MATSDAGIAGVSGNIGLTTGTSSVGNSGTIAFTTGKSTGGKGGSITLSVGEGDTGIGGHLTVNAGNTLQIPELLVEILLQSGESVLTSSGALTMATPNAGIGGVSGNIGLTTGTSSVGNSGTIAFTTGKSTGGKGGSITLSVGEGDTGIGGDLILRAGITIADSGNTGGNITIVQSGESVLTSSGALTMATPNAGIAGVSGNIGLTTGTSSVGNSGTIAFTTGKSTGGKGGSITLSVGEGDTGVGGDVTVKAGNTIADSGTTGGKMIVQSGESVLTSSGALTMATPNAGIAGVSGNIEINTGTSTSGALRHNYVTIR